MISIIVPVYNDEKNIERCIISILGQSEQNFELILVDDGSTDQSAQICDHYAQHYRNIRVVHQENRGLSAARNIGMKASSGQFITFIDSDDWVHKEYLRILRSYIGDCDLCCGYFQRVEDFCEDTPLTNKKPVILTATQALKRDRCYIYVWGKLYRKSSIGDTIFVEGMRSAEDRAFNARFLTSNPDLKVCMLSDILYYYYKHPASITAQPSFSDLPAIYDMMQTVKETKNELLLLYCIKCLNIKLEKGKGIGDPPDYKTVRRYLKQCRNMVFSIISDPKQKWDLILKLTFIQKNNGA